MKYCANRPAVTCKLEGNNCLHLGDRLQGSMGWEERKLISVFILHFNQVLASDSGSYRCFVNSSSGFIESHSVTTNVTGEFSRYQDYLIFFFFWSCFKKKRAQILKWLC